MVQKRATAANGAPLWRGYGGRKAFAGLPHHHAAAPRSAMILSATRQALAMMVSVGLAPVPVGKGDPSTDVEVVDLVGPAPFVENRCRRIVAHPGGAVLVRAIAGDAVGIDLLDARGAGRLQDVGAAVDQVASLVEVVLRAASA